MEGDFSSGGEVIYNRIQARELSRTTAQEAPRAVLIGGQPGSGKSTFTNAAELEFRQSGGAIVIDADKMREANPQYQRLVQIDPLNAADRTHKQAGQWAVQLTQAAIDNKRNLVVDGTMRNPEGIVTLATRLQEAGYHVEARVLAVDPEISLARARLRFEQSVVGGGPGRFVNKEQHDNAYKGIVDSVRLLESTKAVDAMELYDRARRLIYANHQEASGWVRKAEAGEVLQAERTRPWTRDERAAYIEVLQTIDRYAAVREVGTAAKDKWVSVPDRQETVAQIAKATRDLADFEKSPTYQRAAAFDRLPAKEALSRHPELDAAYKQLQNGGAREAVSAALHKGQIPETKVTIDESRQIIDLAANYRGLIVRDAKELAQNVEGKVVAMSSHHVLVKMSELIAVRYEKEGLDKAVSIDQRVSIQHGPDKSQVHEPGKTQDEAKERGRGMGYERDLNR